LLVFVVERLNQAFNFLLIAIASTVTEFSKISGARSCACGNDATTASVRIKTDPAMNVFMSSRHIPKRLSNIVHPVKAA
jgi:hypothetical protein